MNKIEFSMAEIGFIKEAIDQGIDAQFLYGFLKQAQNVMDTYGDAISLAEKNSGDPHYRSKLANELLYCSPYIEIVKTADGEGIQGILSNPKALGLLQGFGKLMGATGQGAFGQGGVGGGVAGGGVGALLGLLMGKIMFNDPLMGLMLGATGGGVLGNMYGSGTLGDMAKQWSQPTGEAPQPTATAGNTIDPSVSKDVTGPLPNAGGEASQPSQPGDIPQPVEAVPTDKINPQPLVPRPEHQAQLMSQIHRNSPSIMIPPPAKAPMPPPQGNVTPMEGFKPPQTSMNPQGKQPLNPATPFFPKP
jgi:hypothetical protein